MEKEIAEKIIEKLGAKLNASGKLVKFDNDKYDAVEFRKENFREIADSAESSRIAFIDGGNNTILDSASFCLESARVYWTIYSGNRRQKSGKRDFFILASSSGGKFDVDVFGADEKFSGFDAFDSTISVGSHMASPNAVACACRKLSELRQAVYLVDELDSGDIIVLDRDLQANVTGENEILGELYSKAEKKGVVVCGISKTTRLFTDTGDSAAAAVSAIAPAESWSLHIADTDYDRHMAGIYFARLHKSSKYIFRFEIYSKQKESAGKALSMLKQNSKDPVFLGYPYGLIEADKLARVSNSEAEYMRVRLMAKAGKDSSRLLDYMKSIDAHSVLDNIS